MPAPCKICTDSAATRTAATLIAEGLSDQAIAIRLGGMSRMAVQRHRRNHIIKPAQDRLAVIEKGAGARQERRQLARAAASDAPEPQAFIEALLGLRAQAEKLAAVEARLERMADAAEAGRSANGVAQLSAQQLRSVEVGSKLAGIGGYAPAKAGADAAGSSFSVNIFLGDGRVETIAAGARPIVEADERDGF